jgi:hypothetical protein
MGKSIRNLSTVTRVGLDLAKRVFQVHAVEAKDEIVVARKLTRSQLIPFFAELPRRFGPRLSTLRRSAVPDPARLHLCVALCQGIISGIRG